MKLVCQGKLDRVWAAALEDACPLLPNMHAYFRTHYNRTCPRRVGFPTGGRRPAVAARPG